jgi:cytochrome c peroxidase
MWDGREQTLESQAINATLGHAQALRPPTDEQVAQMVDFEIGIFSAQLSDRNAGSLTAGGAFGGPVALSGVAPGQRRASPFTEFDAWSGITGARADARRAIARGQAIFNSRTFTISNVAGFNNAVGSNTVAGTCGSCHSQASAGSDSFPGAQHDIGIGGQGVAFGGPALAADLPVFRLTCNTGNLLYNPAVVTTNDPGKALITGRCADIGTKTVPSLRALASHEPYFSDGSAATLGDLVDIYDDRFAMGLTSQERCDLVSFLNSL